MKSKEFFQTDPSGFYLYPTQANELFLSPGSFNIPFGAVELPPPDAGPGMVQRWAGDAWSEVEDNRGASLYLSGSSEAYVLGSVVEIGNESVSYDGGGPIPDWLARTPSRQSDNDVPEAE